MCTSHRVYNSQRLHPLTTVLFFFLNKVPLGTVEGDGRAFLILSCNFFHKKLWLQKIIFLTVTLILIISIEILTGVQEKQLIPNRNWWIAEMKPDLLWCNKLLWSLRTESVWSLFFVVFRGRALYQRSQG